MALYTPHRIFHLQRLLYVRPETFGPYYVYISLKIPIVIKRWFYMTLKHTVLRIIFQSVRSDVLAAVTVDNVSFLSREYGRVSFVINVRGTRFLVSSTLTPILLAWTIWRALSNASKWRMGFNSAFKGLGSLTKETIYIFLNTTGLSFRFRAISSAADWRSIQSLQGFRSSQQCSWRLFFCKTTPYRLVHIDRPLEGYSVSIASVQ